MIAVKALNIQVGLARVHKALAAYARRNSQENLRCNEHHLFIKKNPIYIQSGAAGHSLGFEDEDLGSSPGWWAASVAIYCPSRPGELPKSSSSKPSE